MTSGMVLVAPKGKEAQRSNHNSPHHRMYAEFVAFETIISENQKEQAQKALEHSLVVMSVLEAAAASMT